MNRHSCRLCLKKSKIDLVNVLFIPELAKSIKSFFGFEITAVDTCSNKVCGECISLISDALTYKNRVIYNQECIKKEMLLRSQLQSVRIKVEGDSDDDVVILDEIEPESKVTSSQISSLKKITKVTARKSTSKLPYKTSRFAKPIKRLCPKRLKVVCRSIKERDVAHVRLDQKTREILKLKCKDEKQNINDEKPDIITLGEKLERIMTIALKSNSMRATPINTMPFNIVPGSSFACLPSLNQAPAVNVSTSKPIATVNPSEINSGTLTLCSPQNQETASQCTTKKISIKSPRVIALLNKYRPQMMETNNLGQSVISIGQTLLTAHKTTSPIVNRAKITANKSSIKPPISSSSPAPVLFHYSIPKPAETATSAASPMTSIHNYPSGFTVSRITGLKQLIKRPSADVSSLIPNANLSLIPNANLQPQQQSSPANTSQNSVQNVNGNYSNVAIDKRLPQNKVKVLSVNELNTRVSSTLTSVANPVEKKQRLPIRISLTRVRNEIVIKLCDSDGDEILYTNLDAAEKTAVKSSLMAKESIKQFGQAFHTCFPDDYTLGLLNTLGLSRHSFIGNACNN